MKHDEEIMEILAAYDLTGSSRATAELTGCSHQIEEWVEASKGRIRADKAHERLLALGYAGSERSTRCDRAGQGRMAAGPHPRPPSVDHRAGDVAAV